MNNENKNIFAAFIKAQADMSNPKKGSDNPFFRSKYASLNEVREAILPVLNANDIGVIQPIVNIDGKNYVKTSLIHVSGETIDSYTEITPGKQNDPQAFGSATSYARRYGLQSLVCVSAEDDDAESSMNRVPQQQNKQASKTPAKTNSVQQQAPKQPENVPQMTAAQAQTIKDILASGKVKKEMVTLTETWLNNGTPKSLESASKMIQKLNDAKGK